MRSTDPKGPKPPQRPVPVPGKGHVRTTGVGNTGVGGSRKSPVDAERRAKPAPSNTTSGTSSKSEDLMGLDLPPHMEPKALAKGILLTAVVVVAVFALLPSASRAPLSANTLSGSVSSTAPSASGSTGTAVRSGSGSQSGTTTGTTVVHHTSTTTTPPTTASPGTATGSTIPNNQIQILVANATQVGGEAGTISSLLSSKGYATIAPVVALTVLPNTFVYPVGNNTPQAQQVIASLGLPATALQVSPPIPVTSTGSATVVVAVGSDLASRYPVSATPTTAG